MAILLNPRLWLWLAVTAAVAFVLGFTYRAGKASVRADFEAYKATQAEQRILVDRANRSTERAWQDSANATMKAKDEAILNINARLSDALGRLSERPARPIGDVPAPACTAASGTGSGLYRPDGEFLAGLASRAATIAAERDACYRQYRGLQP